jgi:hypothetical protein
VDLDAQENAGGAEHQLANTNVDARNAFSSVVAGRWGRNGVAVWGHTLQKLEEVTVCG